MNPDPTPTTIAPESSRERHFRFEGVVRLVDREDGVVSIDHEEIPGLMPAMLMDFRPEDPELLDDVIADDEVVGEIRADSNDRGELEGITLVDLVVARPALAPLAASSPAETVLKPGDPVPNFAVTTQSGTAMRLSELRGKVVVLTFVYTRCPLPDYCPLMDRRFAEVAEWLGRSADRAERVRLLSVSFDPEHDTPKVLAEHAGRVGAEPPVWTYAVADHDELRRIAEPIGLRYAPMTDEIRHSLSTSVIAPDGTLALLELGNDWEAADLIAEIRRLAVPPR